MLRWLLVLAALCASTAWAGEDRAHDFVEETLGLGRLILEQKDEGGRTRGICELLNNRLGSERLADDWLGEYAQLERQQEAVHQFRNMVPSIVMSKLLTVLSGEVHGGYTIDPISVEHEDGLFEVGVEFYSDSGDSYRGSAFVQSLGESREMKLVDITYLGISAARYMGRDYRRVLDQEFAADRENSRPVEALIAHIRSQTGFRDCSEESRGKF